jgi:hypothetical protein
MDNGQTNAYLSPRDGLQHVQYEAHYLLCANTVSSKITMKRANG